MAATAIDSQILGNNFSTEAMRRVFSDENRVRKYLEFETALARVQARLGIIPEAAAAEIQMKAKIETFDLAELARETERIGYPVLPVVRQLAERCAGGLGEWCHWGATTQDVTDTATVMQMREAFVLIESDLASISNSLADIARRYRDTPMAGRSNLQQAVPTTFGFKAATLLSAVRRHRVRLSELKPRVLVGEFGGAVGTLASLGSDGLRVQEALMAELRLEQPEIAWHTIRDNVAEAACFLGLVTGTLAKLATDVKLLMQTEVAEAAEPFTAGRGSSSTMPQKRNPVSCLYITACASMVRQQVAALLEAMVQDHERATGTWQIEWIALPEIFLLSSGALAHARTMLAGLEVDAGRMRENLGITHGLIVSEAVMMGVAPFLGRARAHDLIYSLCRRAIEQNRPLVDLLAENAEISHHFDRPALERLTDPSNYLGQAGEMIDRVLART
jgi:3-carboxy-cis,cis-muconate cycloisomerase